MVVVVVVVVMVVVVVAAIEAVKVATNLDRIAIL